MKKNGSNLPHRQLKDLLAIFVEQMKDKAELRPDLVLAGWAEIASPQWQGMTQASSFEKGEIVIKVKNAALYSLLVQQEGKKLLKKLQEKFPNSGIKKIKFCIG